MNLVDQSLRRIGIAIRDRRAARRLTLGDLAQRSGLSLSFLSRVERGQAQTSVGNLIRIADALGGTIHDLIGSPEAEDAGFTVFRAAEAAPTAIPGSGYRWTPVSSGGPGRGIEATLLELPAAGADGSRFSHPGEEICFVLAGCVRFAVGERVALLAAGDAIHLRSDIPHTAAAHDGPARVLMVTHHPAGTGRQPDWWNHGAPEPPPPQDPKEEDR